MVIKTTLRSSSKARGEGSITESGKLVVDRRKSGPAHQSEFCNSLEGSNPRVPISAGLSKEGKYNQ